MAETENPLAREIDMQISVDGPMSLATYMGLCLTHPTHGYYKRKDPFGQEGDFITAPEISQMFGEMIGFYLAALWQQMQAPARFELLELGPGRGTLMSDALRAIARAPGFAEGLDLKLLETNQDLRAAQNQRLAAYEPTWIDTLDEIAEDGPPLFIVANEFFDALPIRQYQRHKGHWHERLIGLKDGKRVFGLSPTPMPETQMPAAIKDAEENAVWEISPAALDVMDQLARRITRRGGALLAIDYGYAQSQTGETFQAIANHEFTDPFANPGAADLTAHVDFEKLGEMAERAGAKAWPLLTQAQFLAAMGIGQRYENLKKANPGQEGTLQDGLARLIDPRQMGTLFKAFCVSSSGIAPYPFAR